MLVVRAVGGSGRVARGLLIRVRMKRQSARPLALRKLTIANLSGTRGGWHYASLAAYCSGSCNTCREGCGIEPDFYTELCEPQATDNTCAQFVCQ